MSRWAFENDPLFDMADLVPELRNEFEKQLGRAMTTVEWAALDAHVKSHAETVMKPTIAKIRSR
jgi:hypothetical protein